MPSNRWSKTESMSLLLVRLWASKQNLRGIGRCSSGLIYTCAFPSPSFEPADVVGNAERAYCCLRDHLHLTERNTTEGKQLGAVRESLWWGELSCLQAQHKKGESEGKSPRNTQDADAWQSLCWRLGAIETWQWRLPESFNNSGISPHRDSQVTSKVSLQSYTSRLESDGLHWPLCPIQRGLLSLSLPYSVWISLNWVLSLQLPYSIPFPVGRHGVCQHQEWFPSLYFYFCLNLDRNYYCLTSIPPCGGRGEGVPMSFTLRWFRLPASYFVPPSSPRSYFLRAWAIFSSDIWSNNSILFQYPYATALRIW